jgi:hypothetical protein
MDGEEKNTKFKREKGGDGRGKGAGEEKNVEFKREKEGRSAEDADGHRFPGGLKDGRGNWEI